MDIAPQYKPALIELLLSIADDKLMLGQRNSDWTGLGPILEEDIAFSSIAQDEIGHATALYEFIAALRGGVSPDQLAYARKPEQYRCCDLVVIEDDFDWAVAMTRQFFCDHLDLLRLERLAHSSSSDLAALAKRLHAEETIHVGHADGWMARLGKASPESTARMVAAVKKLSPLVPGLFEPTTGLAELESNGLYPAADLRSAWFRAIEFVLASGGLSLDGSAKASPAPGGRTGRHSPAFANLLAEMTQVAQVEPDAQW